MTRQTCLDGGTFGYGAAGADGPLSLLSLSIRSSLSAFARAHNAPIVAPFTGGIYHERRHRLSESQQCGHRTNGAGELAHGITPTGTPRYFMSNLIASCAQPDTGAPFDEVSGR
jgi:hypothetical protein